MRVNVSVPENSEVIKDMETLSEARLPSDGEYTLIVQSSPSEVEVKVVPTEERYRKT